MTVNSSPAIDAVLPRRLPDRETVRSGEARDITRAIRCIERWCGASASASLYTAAIACLNACDSRADTNAIFDKASWLSEHLRRVPFAELRRRLAEIEAREIAEETATC